MRRRPLSVLGQTSWSASPPRVVPDHVTGPSSSRWTNRSSFSSNSTS
ncbi:Uncharacterised protein [Mycobacteroides abscessus]|nr:Uncharacterised protein [Mycobacteroides abscessus]